MSDRILMFPLLILSASRILPRITNIQSPDCTGSGACSVPLNLWKINLPPELVSILFPDAYEYSTICGP
jgi:hypothetical protein